MSQPHVQAVPSSQAAASSSQAAAPSRFQRKQSTTPALASPASSSNAHNASIVRRLFTAFADDQGGREVVTRKRFLQVLRRVGIPADDLRVASAMEHMARFDDNDSISFEDFSNIARDCPLILERIVQNDFIIQDFPDFTEDIRRMYEDLKANKDGHVATYIPQLGRVSPDKWGVAVCTVDGQRCSFGDVNEDFCVQSTCKPINYCIALQERGEDLVHNHIGREPSGHGFNNLALDRNHKPHNPMINSGAIMCCSLIQPEAQAADRFDHVMNFWGRLAGSKAKFNNSVYLSERATADRNFALAYFMRENRAFPEGVDLHEVLEFYFMCCSIELNANQMATVAATLASGGICPLTGERILSQETVKHCLSLMYSCGMYDYSGEFAYTIGLPAKSGVSGALMIVVPNVMGICTWAPPLDAQGNSVKGVEFSKRLVGLYNFHNYDVMGGSNKKDPRRSKLAENTESVTELLWAAQQGDMGEIQRMAARGVDLNAADYDGRTALHLAASENWANVVRFLVSQEAVINPIDRWGNTPLADAVRSGNEDVAAFLRAHGATAVVMEESQTPSGVSTRAGRWD